MNKAEQGCELPLQIPIDVRCQIDPQYRHVFQQLRRPNFFKTDEELAQYIDRIHSPCTRAMTLVTMLEIFIEDSSPLHASNVLRAIIAQRGTLDFLTNVKEPQLANLIASYVRRMKIITFSNNSRSWKPSEFIEMLYFTDQIWNLCSPWYNVSISERPTLFAEVIARLEGIEIPFCL